MSLSKRVKSAGLAVINFVGTALHLMLVSGRDLSWQGEPYREDLEDVEYEILRVLHTRGPCTYEEIYSAVEYDESGQDTLPLEIVLDLLWQRTPYVTFAVRRLSRKALYELTEVGQGKLRSRPQT
jgi:hypothetical protein